MMRFATIAACALLATAANAAPYFTGAATQACIRLQDLAHPAAPACHSLPASTRLDWDGVVLARSFERYGGNVARVRLAEPALKQRSATQYAFVYANFLVRTPAGDPLRRDYVALLDTFGCRWKSRVEEGALAFAHRDGGWLRQAECRAIPAGTPLTRIEPELAGTESIWRVRAQIPGGQGATLWTIRPQ